MSNVTVVSTCSADEITVVACDGSLMAVMRNGGEFHYSGDKKIVTVRDMPLEHACFVYGHDNVNSKLDGVAPEVYEPEHTKLVRTNPSEPFFVAPIDDKTDGAEETN